MATQQKKTIEKTVTEQKSILNFFSEFKTEYIPFINWYIKPNGEKNAILEFVEDRPTKYMNKWEREQWKIKVIDDMQGEAYLSGGKRLFQTILAFCSKHNKLPTELGVLILHRIGSGFDTRYKFDFFDNPTE